MDQYPHGHSYRLELTIGGPIVTEDGRSDEGMIVDFGVVSALLKKHIKDVLDHRFLAYENDLLLKQAFAGDLEKQLKIIFVPFVPTSENIVAWCYNELKNVFPSHIRVVKLRLYETSKSWTEYIV